jgi:hypothetical protein
MPKLFGSLHGRVLTHTIVRFEMSAFSLLISRRVILQPQNLPMACEFQRFERGISHNSTLEN